MHGELRRRHAELGYVRNDDGTDVDFLARFVGAGTELIQVCAEAGDDDTLAREVRALTAARRTHPRARCRLLLGERIDRPLDVGDIVVQSIPEWLLETAPA